MSTRQSWEYAPDRSAAARAAVAEAERRLRLERQRAERAMIAYRQNLDRVRESERRGRQAAAEHARNRRSLDRLAGREAALAGELSSARRDLDGLARDLEASRSALAAAEAAVEAELACAARLAAEVGAQSEVIAGAIGDAQTALGELADLGRASAESVRELSPAEREAMAARQRDLEAGIRRLEAEVRLLAHDEATAPAALMTLLAMEANGYHLRETVSAEGLVAYFEHADAAHQIAVRTRPAKRDRAEACWQMTAETFGLAGESCLFEIEDFETAVESLDLGLLAPGDRVYPKAEPGGVARGAPASSRELQPLPPPRRTPAGGATPGRRKAVDRG